jgi:hypothetical protein
MKENEILSDQLGVYKQALLKLGLQKHELEEKLKKKKNNANVISHSNSLDTNSLTSGDNMDGIKLTTKTLPDLSISRNNSNSHNGYSSSVSRLENYDEDYNAINITSSGSLPDRNGSEELLSSSLPKIASLMSIDEDSESVPDISLEGTRNSLESLQYQGKRCLLIKHLRHIVTLHNTLDVPPTLRNSTLDFSRCALTDDDMMQVIEWLRLMSIKDINLIDFRSNVITERGATMIATWLLALDSVDLTDRPAPLEIDFKHNLVCIIILLL